MKLPSLSTRNLIAFTAFTVISFTLSFFTNCSKTSTLEGQSLLSSQNPLADSAPSLKVDFTTETLPGLVAFQRNSIATYHDKNGVVKTAAAGVPRFAHDPTRCENPNLSVASGCRLKFLGLQIEPPGRNLLLNSSNFALWSVSVNTVLTPNAAIGPDGTTSATRLQFPNTSGTAVIQTVFEAGKMYTISIYAKANTTNQLVLVVAGSTYQRKILNLTDRWERYTWTVVPAAGEVNLDLNNDTLADGTVDVLIWGAQVEETSLPTSYIPTGNTSVTREYDQPKISDLSWFNQEKGTFLVEYEAKLIDPASEQTLVFMSDDTINNAFKISRRAGESSATFTFKTPASADILLKATGSAGDWTTQAKRMAVLTYTAQTAAFSDTSGADNTVSGNTVAIPVRFTSLTFGHRNLNSVSTLNGFIRRLTYFRRDLSAAEVAGVTNAP